MSAEEQTRFLSELAADLNSRNIQLPSFPDVVISIRTALEDPACTSDRLSSVVRTDPVLVARLLISANSAFHNRAGIEIVDLNLAVSRLGFEVVRNTAIALAVEQIFAASEHKELKSAMKQIWNTSLSLASMSFVIARNAGNINPDNAFLSGLLHEIGKLYILTKARNYPLLMGAEASLEAVLNDWYASVGKSIVESWGFSGDIAASIETDEHLSADKNATATLVDVVFLAKLLLAQSDNDILLADSTFERPADKLKVNVDSLPLIQQAFAQHSQSMRQSIGG
jgi:HD-like signal output (HDOD) protein